VPFALTAITRAQSASLIFAVSLRSTAPALFTSVRTAGIVART
jgi:hypothetical protein